MNNHALFSIVLFILSALVTGMANAEQQCQRVDIAGSTIWFPYSYLDEEGTPRGIAHDLANEILTELNLDKAYHPHLPWRRIQKSLTFGSLDLLVSNHWTPKRAQTWQLTAEIGQEKLYVFTLNSKLTDVSKWRQLKGFKGIVTRGTALGENYHDVASELSVLEVLAHRQAFTMLIKGRADYFLLTESAAKPYLQEEMFLKVKRSKQALERYSIRMSFSKKSACSMMFQAFNQKLISKIANGRLAQLSDKYANLQPLKIDE